MSMNGEARIYDMRGQKSVDPVWIRETIKRWCKTANIMTTPKIVLLTFAAFAELQWMSVFKAFRRIPCGLGADYVFSTSKNRSLETLDIARFFPGMSLASVAKSFNREKLEWKHELTTLKSFDDPEFQTYAKNDAYLCDVCWKDYRKMVYEKVGVDPQRYRTPARVFSIASCCWRDYVEMQRAPIRDTATSHA